MNDSPLEALLADLKQEDAMVRNQATQKLWQLWFTQKGIVGLEALQQAETWLELGSVRQAEELLTQLIDDLPDFAEAWNRRAVLYYTQGQYQRSLADCHQVLQLNPVHFGAWHGLGLCYLALEDYQAAIKAFRRALEIQPYALANQRFILECTAKLS